MTVAKIIRTETLLLVCFWWLKFSWNINYYPTALEGIETCFVKSFRLIAAVYFVEIEAFHRHKYWWLCCFQSMDPYHNFYFVYYSFIVAKDSAYWKVTEVDWCLFLNHRDPVQLKVVSRVQPCCALCIF